MVKVGLVDTDHLITISTNISNSILSVMNPPIKPKLLPKPGAVKVHRALYSYEAKTSEELSFEEGDVIYVFHKSSDGWWRAKCNGRTGLIPYNYVTESDEVKQPLHDAVRRGNLAFLQECISQGVSPTGLDVMGNTALYWAAHSGHLDCLQVLLDLPNPPLNAQNHVGDTPLHAAASRGHLDAVEALVEKGANVSIKNQNDEFAEDLAINSAIKNLLQLRRQSQTTNLATYDPEEYDDDSDT